MQNVSAAPRPPSSFSHCLGAQLERTGNSTQIPNHTTPITEAPITSADRSHWSFAPIKNQPIPVVKATAWPRTPIDAFIRAKLEAKSIEPQPEAGRPTLLRRLSFDLTGLPPT